MQLDLAPVLGAQRLGDLRRKLVVLGRLVQVAQSLEHGVEQLARHVGGSRTGADFYRDKPVRLITAGLIRPHCAVASTFNRMVTSQYQQHDLQRILGHVG